MARILLEMTKTKISVQMSYLVAFDIWRRAFRASFGESGPQFLEQLLFLAVKWNRHKCFSLKTNGMTEFDNRIKISERYKTIIVFRCWEDEKKQNG